MMHTLHSTCINTSTRNMQHTVSNIFTSFSSSSTASIASCNINDVIRDRYVDDVDVNFDVDVDAHVPILTAH